MYIAAKKFVIVLFVLSLSIFHSAFANTPFNGVTQGQFAVSPTGAATYTIPIEVPPGINGMQPNLALTYNSQAGNGLLGVGWNLSGLSAITRCPKTYAQDGVKAGIKLDSSDRYCLDGQRLIPKDGYYGNYGVNGKEYRTEIDSYAKIVSYGYAGFGPAYFKVWTKSGRIIEFGNTGDSKGNVVIVDTGASRIFRWAINKVTDTSGNTMVFHYNEVESDGYQSISYIEYLDSTQVGNYSAKVEFLYSGDPDVYMQQERDDVIEQFVAGARIRIPKLLIKINTIVNGAIIKKIKLRYENSMSTKRSRILYAKVCDTHNNCKEPVNFHWSDQANTFANQQTITNSYGTNSTLWSADYRKIHTGDFNGDGRADLLFQGKNNSASSFLMYGTDSGFTNALNITNKYGTDSIFWNATYRNILTGDFDGDGRSDLLFQGKNNSSSSFLMYGTDSGFTNALNITNKYGADSIFWNAAYRNILAGDFDGDGRTDLLLQGKNNSSSSFLMYGTDTGFTNALNITNKYGTDSIFWNATYRNILTGDFDGDGKIDLLFQGKNNSSSSFLMHGTDSGFTNALNITNKYGTNINYWSAEYRNIHVADFNGDGLTDLLLQGKSNSLGTFLLHSAGNGFNNVENITTKYGTNANYWSADYRRIHIGDFNGDGLSDLLLRGTSNSLGTFILLGSESEFVNVDDITNKFDANSKIWSAAYRNLIAGDFNGDGKQDLVMQGISSGYTSYLFDATLYKTDYINTINNGFSSIQYTNKPITSNSVYSKYSDSRYPYRDIQSPTYVVESVTTEDGAGGTNKQTYHYEGAKVHLQGRGFLGFAKTSVTDEKTGIVTETEYRQDFPYTGNPTSTVQRLADGRIISENSYFYNHKPGDNSHIYRPYVVMTESKEYEINQGYQYNDPSRIPLKITSTTVYDISEGGDPTLIFETVKDQYGTFEHKTTTSNYYASPMAYGVWNPSLLRTSWVAADDAFDSEPAQTRESEFNYYYGSGLLKEEIQEPDYYSNDPDNIYLKTSYTYDTYGEVKSITVSGSPYASHSITPRTTSYEKVYREFADGAYFVETVTNALDESEVRYYDPATGQMVMLKGPNSLWTYWDYDGFGRLIKIRRPDGTEISENFYLCDSTVTLLNCNANKLAYYSVTTESGEGDSYVFYDKFGREKYTVEKGFLNKDVYRYKIYNDRGMLEWESNNFYLNGAKYATYSSYDDLGRIVSYTTPATPISMTTTTVYDGLKVEIIEQRFTNVAANRAALKTTQYFNPLGQLTKSVDADLNEVSYTYYPFGEEKTVSTSPDHVITKEYDKLGRVTKIIDPDMGTWTYEYDALGNLRKQTNGNQQTTTLTYDLLDRLTDSLDESTGDLNQWEYYGVNEHFVGRLKRAYRTSDGYEEKYIYDSYGRIFKIINKMDGRTNQVMVEYDQYSRVLKVHYPQEYFVKVNVYDSNGYLEKVYDDVGSSTEANPLWWAVNANVYGQVTMERYGNGLVTTRGYAPASGELQYITTGSGNSVQDLHYKFDNFGNLEEKIDYNQMDGINTGVTETYYYDKLNRLTNVDRNNVTNYRVYRYDDNGNLRYKSDMGNLAYNKVNNAGPHAVTSINGSTAFTYDKAGNLKTGRGKTITYTSFNKPSRIQQTGASVDFKYNPDGERYKKVVTSSKGTRTVYYIGKIFELVQTESGSWEYKNYVYAGDQLVAIDIARINGGVDEVNYVHLDHQGSIDVISKEAYSNGTWVKERSNYDPFGKPLAIPYKDGAIAKLLSEVTTRGYTGHEMLNDVGLVHMNGRVYDPEMGRFISADPYIPDPTYSQSYNRYSYVFNNPVSLVDPSGYSPCLNGENSQGYCNGGLLINIGSSYDTNPYSGLPASAYSPRSSLQASQSIMARQLQGLADAGAAARARNAQYAAVDQQRRQEMAARSMAAFQSAQARINAERQQQMAAFREQALKYAAMAASFIGPSPETVLGALSAFQNSNYLLGIGLAALAVVEITPWGKVAKIAKLFGRVANRTLKIPKSVGAQVTTTRVRHYTSKSSAGKIEEGGIIKLGDSGCVFCVSASERVRSPRDIEAALGIKRGRGNAYIEFDAAISEFDSIRNPLTGARELKFRGNIDLSERNATFHRNR